MIFWRWFSRVQACFEGLVAARKLQCKVDFDPPLEYSYCVCVTVCVSLLNKEEKVAPVRRCEQKSFVCSIFKQMLRPDFDLNCSQRSFPRTISCKTKTPQIVLPCGTLARLASPLPADLTPFFLGEGRLGVLVDVSMILG